MGRVQLDVVLRSGDCGGQIRDAKLLVGGCIFEPELEPHRQIREWILGLAGSWSVAHELERLDLAPPDCAHEQLFVAAGQRLARVGPGIGVRLMLVIVLNVFQDTSRQFLHRAELAAAQDPPRQDPEPDLDLIEPTAVLGGVIDHVLVCWVLQEGPALGAAVTALAGRLAGAEPASRALRDFRDYVVSYAASPGFTALASDTQDRKDALGQIRYCTRIRGDRGVLA